jgi:hypothetical protein
MYSSLQPSRLSNEKAASKTADTRWDLDIDVDSRDSLTSLVKSGDLPLRAISRITLDENIREIVANRAGAKSLIVSQPKPVGSLHYARL